MKRRELPRTNALCTTGPEIDAPTQDRRTEGTPLDPDVFSHVLIAKSGARTGPRKTPVLATHPKASCLILDTRSPPQTSTQNQQFTNFSNIRQFHHAASSGGILGSYGWPGLSHTHASRSDRLPIGSDLVGSRFRLA